MPLSLCVLGSGSSGNCTYVGSDSTRILIDAGLSGRETADRLGRIGVGLEGLSAVCLTHEHDDHTSALSILARRAGLALYANAGTIQAFERRGRAAELPWRVFTTGSPFTIGDLTIEPFSVPHDSYDPVGFAVQCGRARVGIVTDMGMSTELIRARLRHCSVLVVESNHDPDLLRGSKRPWGLKQRIAGRQGHLSNEQAAELVAGIAGPELRCVLLAHLSAECNDPERACAVVRSAIDASGYTGVAVKLTYPDRPSDVVTAGL
jgi:phosphoribosyl 1,2-cyclic phosphodiesterase